MSQHQSAHRYGGIVRWSDVPAVWVWRGVAAVSLVLALLCAWLALVSSGWWGLLCLGLLAATVVCLVRSEPDQAGPPPWPTRDDRGTVAPQPAMRRHRVPAASDGGGRTVKDVMTANPVALPATAPVSAAARAMRELDVGAVVVVQESRALGILTDRDIVVRALARDRGPGSTTLAEICSRDLATVPANSRPDEALQVMGARAVRRLPVTAGQGRVVGIVSIGDLVERKGSTSALSEIHDAIPNR
jgi:CBS domain-containing protein